MLDPLPRRSQVLWPRPSLGGCTFATLIRDTRGSDLSIAERFNHFPAGAFCAVTVMIVGEGRVVVGNGATSDIQAAPIFPTFAVSGPQRGPTVSWNPGDVLAATIVMYPDAFAVLTGHDVGLLVDRFVDAETVLPAAVFEVFSRFRNAARVDNIQRSFAFLEDGLEHLWERARPRDAVALAWLQDWGRSVAARAALSGTGRSARQVARRVKASTGLTDRDLEAFGRSEKLFARMGQEKQAGRLDWAELASDVGFSDQAHMSRRVRRDTGLAPGEFLRAIENDEAYWCYRLLGERY